MSICSISPRDRAATLIRECGLPARVTKKGAEALLKQYAFETSYRSLERWPLRWRRLAGKNHVETIDLLEEAFRRLDEAPLIAA